MKKLILIGFIFATFGLFAQNKVFDNGTFVINNAFEMYNGWGWREIVNNYVTDIDNQDYRLTRWKIDVINSYYENTNNCKILFIGDSFTLRYGEKFKIESPKIFGDAGGSISARWDYSIESGGYYISINQWGRSPNHDMANADTYTIHGYHFTTDTVGAVIKAAIPQWDKLQIRYLQNSGCGTFRFKVGYSGTWLDTVDCVGTKASKWVEYTWGSLNTTAKDTLYIENMETDSVRIYDVQLIAQNQGMECTIWNHSGATIDEYYINSMDTSVFHELLDTLDISLTVLIFLEDQGNVYANMDSLVKLLNDMRPQMDILILVPNETSTGIVASQLEDYRRVAVENNVAYINMNNYIGAYSVLDEQGVMDGTHLTYEGRYLSHYILGKLLLPLPTKYSIMEADNFSVSDMNTAPISATDYGTKGEIRITTTYIYICTAINTWKRIAVTTW